MKHIISDFTRGTQIFWHHVQMFVAGFRGPLLMAAAAFTGLGWWQVTKNLADRQAYLIGMKFYAVDGSPINPRRSWQPDVLYLAPSEVDMLRRSGGPMDRVAATSAKATSGPMPGTSIRRQPSSIEGAVARTRRSFPRI